jgi:hypothetical protein
MFIIIMFRLSHGKRQAKGKPHQYSTAKINKSRREELRREVEETGKKEQRGEN